MKIQGCGYRQIADKLNESGIPCPKRGRWRNKNQRWSTVTILSILTNPAYYGDRVYNRHPLSKKKIGETNVLGMTKDRCVGSETEWIVVQDCHPSIVTRSQFQKANLKKETEVRRNRHSYESPYLLSGLIKCSYCGFNYQGQNYGASGHRYYVDGGNMNKGKSVCRRTAIPKTKIEEFILAMIEDSVPFSEGATRFEAHIRHFLTTCGTDRPHQDVTKGKLEENQRKIDNLIALAENGAGVNILERIKQLETERRRLEDERRQQPLRIDVPLDPKKAGQYAAQFLLRYRQHFDEAPIHTKKEMLRQFVVGIVVDPEKRVANVAITKIPMVTSALRQLITPSEFVGRLCSGGRVLTAVATLHRSFEMTVE